MNGNPAEPTRPISGIVKQIDSIARRIRLLDGTDIPMDDILTLDGALFDVLD